MPDEDLVRASLSGDPEAFRQLVERHRTRVFTLASRFARDAHTLDDLAQEIFIKIWQRLDQFRADAPFEHWLARVAVHTCYDFLRRQQRGWLWFTLDEAPPLPAPAPDENAEAVRDQLEAAFARLRPKERLVLTLLELEGHSVHEVAALTGWSQSNVKVRAFRAREALRQLLTPPPSALIP